MLKERVLGLIEKHGLDREALIREIRRALPVEESADCTLCRPMTEGALPRAGGAAMVRLPRSAPSP